ncbi:MAG: hypothetical protein NVS4B5_12160 [Vulcanimicrobiaceae bacterium]
MSRAGLSLTRDIFIKPARAFAKIRETHEWIVALGIIAALSTLSAILIGPALLHLAAVTPPPPGQSQPHSPAAIAAAQKGLLGEYALRQIMTPILTVLLTASALTTVARFKAKTTSYITYVALAANCLLPAVLGDFLSGLAIRAHDPTGYANLHSLVVALPTNLAVFSNAHNDAEVSFLSRFDLFSVWSSLLLAFGFAALTPVKVATALAVAFGLELVFAIMF